MDDIEFFQDNAFPSFPLFDWQEKKRQFEQQVAAAGTEPDEETLKALTDAEEELERYQLNLQTEDPILVGDDLAYQQYLDAMRTYETIGEELGMPRPVEPVLERPVKPAERRTKIHGWQRILRSELDYSPGGLGSDFRFQRKISHN